MESMLGLVQLLSCPITIETQRLREVAVRVSVLVWVITTWSMFAVAAPPEDRDLSKPISQKAIESLPELRWRLAVIDESKAGMRRAIALYEKGDEEKAQRALSWTSWGLSQKADSDGGDSLSANDVSRLRTELKELDEYHRLMRRALELHDNGDVAEAHRVSSAAAAQFPNQPGTRWFAEQTKDGQQIPPGATIEFINRTDQVIPSVDLHYRCSSAVFGLSHIHQIVRDLKPGEPQSVYTDDLPKGPTRLYVDFQVDVNGDLFNAMISGRVFSRNSFGFVPIVIIEKDGSVSFSEMMSAMRAERAAANPRPSLKEELERLTKQESQGSTSQ
jgi:hypothetical protein